MARYRRGRARFSSAAWAPPGPDLAAEDIEFATAITDTRWRRPGERTRPKAPVHRPAAIAATDLTPEDWEQLRHVDNTHATGSAGW